MTYWYRCYNRDEGKWSVWNEEADENLPFNTKTLKAAYSKLQISTTRPLPPEPGPGWYKCNDKCGYVYHRDGQGEWSKFTGPTATSVGTTWEEIHIGGCSNLLPVFG